MIPQLLNACCCITTISPAVRPQTLDVGFHLDTTTSHTAPFLFNKETVLSQGQSQLPDRPNSRVQPVTQASGRRGSFGGWWQLAVNQGSDGTNPFRPKITLYCPAKKCKQHDGSSHDLKIECEGNSQFASQEPR